MAKKRLIFTLLYDEGGFMLSRNFRLQRAGDIAWLKRNYNFRKIAFAIDELIILDVSRGPKNTPRFCDHIRAIGEECFIPIAVGGGLSSLEHTRAIMNAGADKLVVNSAVLNNSSFVKELVSIYGSQCVIGSVDVRNRNGKLECYIDNGFKKVEFEFLEYIDRMIDVGVGEIYLNSMDRDGTGHGYMMDILLLLKDRIKIPVIMAGGAGNWHHLLSGLQQDIVDAVATANLFNFIGEGFPVARKQLLDHDINLARWA